MKILFVNQTLGIGGAETFNSQLLSWLNTHGYQVTSYTTNPRFQSLLTSKGLDAHRIPFVVDLIGDWKGFVKGLVLFPLAWIYYLLIVLVHHKSDVILMSGYIEKIFITPIAALFNVPVIWIEFAPPFSVLTKFFNIPKILYLLVKNLPKFTLVPSKHTLKSLNPKSPLVIQLGILQSTKPIPILPNHKVCCISRLEKGKGQDLLIKSWTKVVTAIPDATLEIIGEGDQDTFLLQLIKDYHLEKNIKLMGWVPDQLSYINHSQLVVLPTLWPLEGYGMVAVEAMSLMRPVIGFDFGPLPEIIDSQVGELVPPGDTGSLSDSVIRLLTNPQLCRQKGKAGFKKYTSQFTMQQVGQKFSHIFESL